MVFGVIILFGGLGILEDVVLDCLKILLFLKIFFLGMV